MIKIKLTQEQLRALVCAFVGWDANWDQRLPGKGYDFEHAKLLLEFQYDFTFYFAKYRNRNSKITTVKFSSLQAIAFMQMWVDQALTPFPEEQAVIGMIIGILDKASKQPKNIEE